METMRVQQLRQFLLVEDQTFELHLFEVQHVASNWLEFELAEDKIRLTVRLTFPII